MFDVKRAMHLLCICIAILFVTSIVSCSAGKPALSRAIHTPGAWDATKMAKSKLRKELKEKLSHLSYINMLKQSVNITKKLLANPAYKNATRVAVYLNMDNEVQTDDIVRAIFKDGKLCFIPKYKDDKMFMIFIDSIDELTALPEDEWNKFIPDDQDDVNRDAYNTGGVDLMLVPGLGFNLDGRRLGRGVGFYDRLIASYRKKYPKLKLTTIGLSFKEQLCDYIPSDANDMIMDQILTFG